MLRVIVLDDPDDTLAGENDTVTPAGVEAPLNATLSLAPAVTAVVTPTDVEEPALTEPALAPRPSEKSLGASTVNEYVAVWVVEVPVPVTVMA